MTMTNEQRMQTVENSSSSVFRILTIWSIPIKTPTFVFFKYGTFGLLIFTTIFFQYYPNLALSIYLNISISTWITPWNSLLDKLDICIFLLTYFMYYIQVIKYMFTVIIILSTTLYSRHVVFIYLPLYTCLHVTDWKGALDSKH